MKTIAPNYDYTVYNMATEPVVKAVEKYFGGIKACFFVCLIDKVHPYDPSSKTKPNA